MSNLLRCFGFTENRLHLGQTQTVPVWFGSRFALFFERFGSALGLHCFSSLELSHEPQCKPNAEGKVLLALC